ncbi:fibronectin type III domain-containing protein [Adlercreutzia caecimuris]|uniref:fibronectin type III domain-containing protein n=1 Tax=Adlercreutzia caecimuris TaxID=671266 RepID=UPI000ED77934|nr:fibronectin type III domain-containing protein [Adlercreutzia caecimuris]
MGTIKRRALSVLLAAVLAVTMIPAEGLTSKAYAADPVISMGSTQTGTVSRDKTAYYRFSVPSSGKVKISGLAERANTGILTTSIRFRIYQEDGTKVYSSGMFYMPTTGRTYVNLTTYLNKGNYTIEVLQDYSVNDGARYSFALSFESANESFAEMNAGTNNTFDTASAIRANTTYRGMIANNEHHDVYRFSIPSKTNMRVIFNSIDSTRAPKINIYDGNRVKQYSWSYRTSLDGEVVEFSPGTYYFEIDGYDPFLYSFQIASPIPMAATSIKLSDSSYTYDGYAKTPDVAVAYNGSMLRNSRNYTVSYSANKNAGIGKVTVTGKGAYAGSVTKTFKIKPGRPSIKAVKGVKKGFKATWAKKSKAEATGYQVQYSTKKSMKGAKTKTVKGTSKTVKGLKAGKRYYVRVRAYKTVGKQKVYSSWSAKRAITTKRR